MEAYLDRVGLLKVDLITKKKSQKRKTKAHVKGPSAKKGTPLRNKTETTQENSEGDRRKRERTAPPLRDITMKLQNSQVLDTVESNAALNEPGASYSNNTVIRVIPTQDPLNTPTFSTVQTPSKGSEERVLPSTDVHQLGHCKPIEGGLQPVVQPKVNKLSRKYGRQKQALPVVQTGPLDLSLKRCVTIETNTQNQGLPIPTTMYR
ncbi:hypothetical protein NDU88_009428 [Pleurodeles waltl]|uniref:Uncharacterized protein n=1 Tax=Pleurodeles waltl TaxID=8319 RepID=A0AAV7PSQ8_PLEWA|nr:hypothetical protein NDU88_009428 [Pleurodeles waltl]